jgi:PadR family transcriptional regulator, regulatory protein AphA
LSSDSLTPISYVVLVLVGEGGAGPHDLRRMAAQGRIYWSAAPSQWYAEPKRLERLGLLEARKEPGRTRERTRYTLTDKGREALRDWLATPMPFPRFQNEPIVRLLVADLVEPEVMRASLANLRDELAERERWQDRSDQIADSLPERERWLRINHRYARRELEALRAWLDEAERELDVPGE